jgi:hypothetical protein|nr:MAG TPA: hypothetical protein [Caudoviricetes sp.]
MADYSNIQRVVIRKPVDLQDAIKAFEILHELNQQIDVIRIMAERQVLPRIIIDHMMMQIDLKIEEAVKLAGFANTDDMKYFTTHFMNL